MPTFFCDPGKPLQKGSVENLNDVARDYVPFDINPESVTQDYLDQVENTINDRPRKLLNFLTPREVFMREMNKKEESRMKPALPAAEIIFNQHLSGFALHC